MAGVPPKVPPHSLEAERAVIGGLLLDNLAWDDVAELVSEDDFYRRDHRLIFAAAQALIERGDPADVITVSERLEKLGQDEECGGLAALGELVQNTASISHVKSYAALVREYGLLRQLIHQANEISTAAYDPGERSVAEILDSAESAIFSIADRNNRQKKKDISIRGTLNRVVDRLDVLSEMEGSITGLSTGFSDLDDLTSGLQAGDMVVVAGRPSMGKTSFAVNIAENAALNSGKTVLVFSMEMPAEQVCLRMLSSVGKIDQQRLRSGKLEDEEFSKYTQAIGVLSELPFFIDDTPALTPTELRARARRIKRQHDLGLIVVDYLQLMQVLAIRDNRVAEVSEISRSLKALAKELEVPVVVLSQLNRSLEQRPNKRPVMSDLRESGAIEQDADLILFIYRDEVYNEDSPDKGTAEIIIGKQRNGPIGMRRLTFLGQYTRFQNHTAGRNLAGG